MDVINVFCLTSLNLLVALLYITENIHTHILNRVMLCKVEAYIFTTLFGLVEVPLILFILQLGKGSAVRHPKGDRNG